MTRKYLYFVLFFLDQISGYLIQLFSICSTYVLLTTVRHCKRQPYEIPAHLQYVALSGVQWAVDTMRGYL